MFYVEFSGPRGVAIIRTCDGMLTNANHMHVFGSFAIGFDPHLQLHARIYYKFHFPSSSFDHSLLHLKMATYGWIKSRGLQFALLLSLFLISFSSRS